MVETDVALTDYAIFAQCMLFGSLLARRWHAGRIQNHFCMVFFFTGAAALAGGTVHGFFVPHNASPAFALWIATLWLVGAAGIALWTTAARLWLDERWARLVLLIGVFEWMAYAAYVLWVDHSFSVALIQYVPAAAALLAALAIRYLRDADWSLLYGMAGLALTFAAGLLQQIRYTPIPVLLSHNAFYHLLQMAALLGIFITALKISERQQRGGMNRGPA